MPCIYCLRAKPDRPSRQHIFPESLVGEHPDLVLEHGEVCRDCNTRLGSRLESAFKDRLGILPMLLGPGVTKSGKPTTINVPGMWGSRDRADPRIAINIGNHAASFRGGVRVKPANRTERIALEDLRVTPDGQRKLRLSGCMRIDQVLIRGLTKIGFETICVHRGAEYCADVRWHRVRDFIVRGKGERTYAMPRTLTRGSGSDGWAVMPAGIRLHALPTTAGEQWIAAISLGLAFLIDLSVDNNVLVPWLAKAPDVLSGRFVVKTARGIA